MNKKVEEESAVQESQSVAVSSKSKTKSANMGLPSTSSTFKTKSRKPNGRLGKRKTRKTVRIKNLDAINFLHNETLRSNAERSGRRLPPPRGCVDYQFTTMSALASNTVPIHSELPPATHDTPYGLQILLDLYREQFMSMIRCMKSDEFRKTVENQIREEKAKQRKLAAKMEQLEKQIQTLIDDSLGFLGTGVGELGVTNGYNTKDLMIKAKEILMRHHELQGEAVQLNHEIPGLEEDEQLVNKDEDIASNNDDILSAELEIPIVMESNLQLEKSKDDDIPSAKLEIPILQEKNVKVEEGSDDEIPSVKFEILISGKKSMKSGKCEDELPVDRDDIPQSELGIRLKDVKSKSAEVPNTSFSITPCSIVLPRIHGSELTDGAKLKLLTPAQKKFTHNEPHTEESIRDSPSDQFSLNNENKPPSEKHGSGHRHHRKSSKKSRKSKKKHKYYDLSPSKTMPEYSRKEKYPSATRFDNIPVNCPVNVDARATASYSRIASNMLRDPIEEIITKTLNDEFEFSDSLCNSESRMSSSGIAAGTNYLGKGITNKDKTEHSDYRRVPPMKIALKKFAQENRAARMMSPNLMGTTVGDLVSSEIEKSLEISNRSTYNQSSVPFDYSINSRSINRHHSAETSQRREAYGRGSYEKPNSKSPFSTPTYVMPSPSHSCNKFSPSYSATAKIREEPLEGLAASMFGACRSSEADSSRHSSPYYTPPMNLELKMNEPSLIPEYMFSGSALTLPNDANLSADQNDADGNKWQEVSLCFDRMFEFVSTKLDSQENVSTKNKPKSKVRDSEDKHSPTFSLNPPSLFRADSSFVDSPLMPDFPVSPASLEGPFSPVPSLSPPSLSSPTSSTAFNQNSENKDEHSSFNEKFRPKGKGWKWH